MPDNREQLLKWREAQGMTLTDLAERMGYDVSYVSRIASGERPIGHSFVGRFAQSFGFDLAEELFGQQLCQESAQ